MGAEARCVGVAGVCGVAAVCAGVGAALALRRVRQLQAAIDGVRERLQLHETVIEYLTHRLEAITADLPKPKPEPTPRTGSQSIPRAHSFDSVTSDAAGYRTADEDADAADAADADADADADTNAAAHAHAHTHTDAPAHARADLPHAHDHTHSSTAATAATAVPPAASTATATAATLAGAAPASSVSDSVWFTVDGGDAADAGVGVGAGGGVGVGVGGVGVGVGGGGVGTGAGAGVGGACADGVADALARADVLYGRVEYAAAAAVLQRARPVAAGGGGGGGGGASACEFEWRLARLSHDMALQAKLEGSPERSRSLMFEGLQLATAALEHDPDNSAAHKWFAILVSATSSLEGTKAAIQKSLVVKAHFEAAVRLGPSDATARHLLGLWYFEVAQLSWATRKLAAALFASPPTGSMAEALEHFMHAERLQPGFYIKNRLLIAKAHLAQRDKAAAREWAKKALELPVSTPDDGEAAAEAKKLLGSLRG